MSFQGLAAFTEADAEFFFGRREIVGRLVQSLKREPRFLAALGVLAENLYPS